MFGGRGGCFVFVAVVEIKERTLLWPYTFIKVTKSDTNKLSAWCHYATYGHYRMSGIRDSHNASLHLLPGLTLIIT